MSIAIAVQDIVNRVAYRCELPTFTVDTNTSSTDVLMLVQESTRRLSGIMGDLSDEAYFATTGTLATVANIPVVSVPANFGNLLGIHWVQTDGTPVLLRQANQEEIGPSQTNGWNNIEAPTYKLTANTIEFFPPPDSVETIKVRYTTGLFVTSLADTLQAALGWDTWVVLDVACVVRQRQDKDYSALSAEKGLIEREIRTQARRRDRAGFATVRDVRHEVSLQEQPWWWRR